MQWKFDESPRAQSQCPGISRAPPSLSVSYAHSLFARGIRGRDIAILNAASAPVESHSLFPSPSFLIETCAARRDPLPFPFSSFLPNNLSPRISQYLLHVIDSFQIQREGLLFLSQKRLIEPMISLQPKNFDYFGARTKKKWIKMKIGVILNFLGKNRPWKMLSFSSEERITRFWKFFYSPA